MTLDELLIEIFNLEENFNLEELKLGETPWDSLMHVNLIFLIESKLGVALDYQEIQEISDYKSLVEVVEKC